MVHYTLILKRFLRRLKYAFNFKDIITWKYESCKKCGHCLNIMWNVKDDIWEDVMSVNDTGGGSLCIDCFITKATKNGIYLENDDFDLMTPFIPRD